MITVNHCVILTQVVVVIPRLNVNTDSLNCLIAWNVCRLPIYTKKKGYVNKKFERSYPWIVFVINNVILLGRYIGSR